MTAMLDSSQHLAAEWRRARRGPRSRIPSLILAALVLAYVGPEGSRARRSRPALLARVLIVSTLIHYATVGALFLAAHLTG